MTSEHLSHKSEYVQQLTFVQGFDESCDFFDVLIDHAHFCISPFIRGKNIRSGVMF